MKTYEELRNEFFKEVAKIDITKLHLDGFHNTYKSYAELLYTLSNLPCKNCHETGEDGFFIECGASTPKIEESEGK